MMQNIKETLVEAFKLGFLANNIGIKSTYLGFLKMGLMDSIHQGTLEIVLIKNFDRLFY